MNLIKRSIKSAGLLDPKGAEPETMGREKCYDSAEAEERLTARREKVGTGFNLAGAQERELEMRPLRRQSNRRGIKRRHNNSSATELAAQRKQRQASVESCVCQEEEEARSGADAKS